MRSLNFFIISFILCAHTSFSQINTDTNAEKIVLIADSLFQVFKYDSSANYYLKAATIYEHEKDWSKCVKNYRLTSNALLKAAKYDTALHYTNKALNIADSNFLENNKDEMFEKSDVLLNMADVYEKNGKFNQELTCCKKAMGLTLKADSSDKLKIAGVWNKTGIVYSNLAKYDSALYYCEKAFSVRKKHLQENHADLAESYLQIGFIFMDKNEHDIASENIEKALHIYITIYGELHPDVAVCYNNIGNVNYFKGNYDTALEYYKKTLYIWISIFGALSPDIVVGYNNIASVYSKKGEYDLALEYYQRSLQIQISIFGEFQQDIAIIYYNIGLIYYLKRDYDKALEYYQKTLHIWISIFGELYPYISHIYNNIGIIYYDKKEYNLALEYYQKALQIRISIFGEFHTNIALSYYNIGELYNKNGETFKALQFYQKALMANVVGFTDSSVYINPMLAKIFSESVLLSILTGKANTFYQLSRNKTIVYRDMEASVSTYELAFQLINKMRNDYNIENTKLLLSETTKKYYSDALQAAMEFDRTYPSLENGEKPFEFIEKGKSATMTARFNEYKAKKIAGITDTLLEVEKELRTKIELFNTQIVKEISQKDGYDTLKISTLENEKFTCSRKLDSLITYFETIYPAYYELKYAEKTATIPDIQKTLGHHTALLDYFVGDSSVFIATITDSLYKIEEIPIDSSFIKLVTKCYKNIKTAEPEGFVTNSQQLFKKLILPVKDYVADKAHLVIIPDDYLYYIPFETLIDNASSPKIVNDDYSKADYLIKSHSISYHHSATLWYNSKKKESELAARTKMNFIGFAPVFSKEQNNGFIVSSNINAIDTTGNNLAYRAISSDMKWFNPLPYSRDEVTSIVHLFKKQKKEAKAYIYGEANETNFKSNAGSYSIVHVSSHGFSNDKEPNLSGIVFSQPTDTLAKEDGVLYTGETYNLNLHADLIVLSSCESGLGKLIKGEGLQALSRGFLYAGAPNVLFSLWKALDKPTKDLMVQFYSNTLDGKTYAESLRQAKLKLINDPKTAFPHFWSGFVLVGR